MMKHLLFGLLFTMSLGVIAQNGWDWGADKIAATRKYQYLTTYMQAKKYQECRQATNWLLVNAPELNVDLYKRASVVYKECAKTSKEADLVVVQDSAVLVYDLWELHFGTQKSIPIIHNKKAKIQYKYLKTRTSTDVGTLAPFYKQTLEENKGKTYLKNVEYFMAISIKQKAKGTISSDQLFDAYNLCLATTASCKKVKAGKEADLKKINKTEAKISKSLMNSVSMSCDDIVTYYAPKLEADPANVNLANAARKFLDKNECNSTSLYYEAVKVVTENDPTIDRYLYLAGLEQNRNQTEGAREYYEKALLLSPTAAQQGEIHLQLAKLYRSQGNKIRARRSAQQVIATGANSSAAHRLIGDLYYGSGDDCANSDVLAARAIYIAAYLEYEKAGATKKMAMAKKQFPSMEDIFVQSKKVGESINTGCWINEDVPLKKR